MSKRARTSGGSVTGGTGDIKPQILTAATGVAGGLDDYVTASVALPVPRFGTMKTRATIFELLGVWWHLALADKGDATAVHWAFLSTVVTRANGDTSTLADSQVDALDPRAFAFQMEQHIFTTSGSSIAKYPKYTDLTDSNGNGILIATDRIILTGGAVGNATLGQYIAKIKYRTVNVGIAEYVGIVQSQQ